MIFVCFSWLSATTFYNCEKTRSWKFSDSLHALKQMFWSTSSHNNFQTSKQAHLDCCTVIWIIEYCPKIVSTFFRIGKFDCMNSILIMYAFWIFPKEAFHFLVQIWKEINKIKDIQIILRLFLVIAIYYQGSSSQKNHSLNL